MLRAGKFRAEKLMPALYSASVQLYVSFSPPNTRSMFRVFFRPFRFESIIFLPPYQRQLQPRAGRFFRRSHAASSAKMLLYWACSPTYRSFSPSAASVMAHR